MKRSKRRKLLVPELHATAKEIEEDEEITRLSDKSDVIPYTQIDTFSDFLDNLDKIEVHVKYTIMLNLIPFIFDEISFQIEYVSGCLLFVTHEVMKAKRF